MGNELKTPLRVSELAVKLGLEWYGSDIEISHIQPLNAADEGALCFSKKSLTNDIFNNNSVVIAPPGNECGAGAIIETENPRLEFARALIEINSSVGFKPFEVAPKLGEDVVICSSANLGRGVIIGSRTYIGHNVVIADGVQIGEDCVIKSNTVIGEAGFGFERNSFGVPVRILHLGNVVIGNRVELGSLNTVCRATLGTTVIEDDVKTDDHVHIAHNCRIRRGALITACAELSGSVDVGEYSWIGPNSSVLQKITVGEKAFIGIGSNVTKPVLAGATVAGNPARGLMRKD